MGNKLGQLVRLRATGESEVFPLLTIAFKYHS